MSLQSTACRRRSYADMGRCWCPSYPAAIRHMVILAGSGLHQLPDSSYLMGTGRLGTIS